jgi:hypothetical protein
MPNLVIINLTPGDTQEDLIAKINQNFDSIVSAGGGPQGQDGPQGDQGPIGSIGPKGDQGVPGQRGTRWFISSTDPSIGATSASGVLPGDFWVNTANNKNVYVYGAEGFITTGTSLQAEDVFITLPNIVGPGSITTKNAIVQASPFPESGTFVLSDSILGSSSANPNYAKLLISTNSSDGYPILEFGKSDAPNIGTPADYNKHPFFGWKNPASSDYGVRFVVPGDLLDIVAGQNLTLQSTSGNVNISGVSTSLFATNNLTLVSGSSMLFDAGSSPINVTSSNFNLTSTSLSLGIPLSIYGSFSGNYMASFTNGGTGGGIYVNLLGDSSTSRYLFNGTTNSSTSRFYVRSDGKVKLDKANYAYSTFGGSATYATGGIDYYSVGPYLVTNGNKIVLSLGAGSNNGIAIPIYSGDTGYGGWGGEFLGVGESITLNIFSGNGSNTISKIYATTTGTSSGGSPTTLTTSVVSLNVTILRTASNTWTVFYDTPYQSGILA